MDFHRIANRGPRGESTRNCAPFSYTSLYGVINCQILNCPGSSNGGLPREIASWRSTARSVRLPPQNRLRHLYITPNSGYTRTNSFVPPRLPHVRSSPSPPIPPIAMASACQAPLRPQSPVTVPAGDEANKKQVLEGSPRPPPDVPMCDATSIAHQLSSEAPAIPATLNPEDVVSDLSSFVSSVLGCAAGSAIDTLAPDSTQTPALLIQLAFAKKLQDIHTTILSVKAKADHAQQVASTALNMASAAASASRTYAQMAAAAAPPPSSKPHPNQSQPAAQFKPKAKTPLARPPAVPATSIRAKKPAQSQASAQAAAAPSSENSPAPSTLSPAQRRLFAPSGTPQKIPNGPTLLQTLPAILANLLLEKKLPREAAIFMASINDNGTVSITAPRGYAASYYAPYYDLLAKATQQHINPENNAYEAFRPAPTSDSLLINRVPVSALPSDPALLQKAIADAVHLSTGIAVSGARTLLPWDKITKLTTSLVIQVPPIDAPTLIKKGILLFNRVRPVRAMWSATPATQCTLCWRFGHPAAGCPKVHPQCCRICGDSAHTARNHPCHQCLAEPTLPKKTDGICPHASPYCINCNADHPANSPLCPKRMEALAEQRARANKLVRGSPPS